MQKFEIQSKFKPSGDQPQAIDQLSLGVTSGKDSQVLLGVTGSGKTFTIANVIQNVQKPTLVLCHNKTLAAQLAGEFKQFFPNNAVEYFVSYYDYYQPESYIPRSDIYIEKDLSINEEIDRLRHSATSAVLERRDVIIVSSVSCIYSLGSPKEYLDMSVSLRPNTTYPIREVAKALVAIGFERNDIDFDRGKFRIKGDTMEIFPSSTFEKAIRVEFFGDEIERISHIDIVTGKRTADLMHIPIFPATHYAISRQSIESGIENIEQDLETAIKNFTDGGKLLEAERISQRTKYDIEMMREIGYCTGIENYSRYFDGRKKGQAPFTLLDYFPDDFLFVVDESHATLPQVRAMYKGDFSRKDNLVNFGFRLNSAYDNRPLKFEEFKKKIGQSIYVSATPADYEKELAGGKVIEQIIRPTGLLDPEIEIKPVDNQIDDLLEQIKQTTENGFRTLVTTLTKKMAERLTEYYEKVGLKVKYMHSDVDTLDRIEIIKGLRLKEFDVLIGINLLREGLDLPEVALVAILDADKEGFLRNETSLIQTIGRAARNSEGRVILYADKVTRSMRAAMDETERRRNTQKAYNKKHGIVPKTIIKDIADSLEISKEIKDEEKVSNMSPKELKQEISVLEERMKKAAIDLEFELAAALRDEIIVLSGKAKNSMKDIGIIRKKIIDLTKEFGFDDFYFTNSAKDACTTLLLFKKYLPSNIDQSNDKASISQYYICSNKSYFSAKTLCDYVNKELGIGAVVNREIKLKNRASNYGGIIGLNSLYYHDTFGSFVVMRAIDLGITLTLSKKSACKQCNKCMACAKACPTGAIDENGYHIEKCLRNMLNGDIPFEHRSKLSQLIGCDLCQTACPMNTKERVDPTSFYLDDLLSNKETKKLKVLCGSNFASKTRIVTQSLCIAVNKQHHDSLKTIKQLLNDDIQKVRYYAEWAYENLYKTK